MTTAMINPERKKLEEDAYKDKDKDKGKGRVRIRGSVKDNGVKCLCRATSAPG